MALFTRKSAEPTSQDLLDQADVHVATAAETAAAARDAAEAERRSHADSAAWFAAEASAAGTRTARADALLTALPTS